MKNNIQYEKSWLCPAIPTGLCNCPVVSNGQRFQLLNSRAGDVDGSEWSIVPVRLGLFNFLDNFRSFQNLFKIEHERKNYSTDKLGNGWMALQHLNVIYLSENDVFTIQPWGGHCRDKELRSVRILRFKCNSD